MFYVVIVLLLFFLFFGVYSHYLMVYGERANLKGYYEIRKAFKRLVKQHQLSVSVVDRFHNRLIAIDRVLGKLVLIIFKDGITWERSFNLDELVFCHVVKTINKESGEIRELMMELTFQDNIGTVNFVFFDETVDDTKVLPKRQKKAKSWKREIQVQLSTRQINKAYDDDEIIIDDQHMKNPQKYRA